MGTGVKFIWLSLVSIVAMRHFDNKEIFVLSDASHLHGLGYALGHMEKNQYDEDRFKIVPCSSKSLTSAQKNYSTTELECLEIVWDI